MESSCEPGNETSGSIKCWELPSGCTTCDLSSGTQLHTVGWSVCYAQSRHTKESAPLEIELYYYEVIETFLHFQNCIAYYNVI
jgi:hypothetical protein